MHENAICQHRHDAAYTVPSVPADWICAARDQTRRGDESPDGDLAMPCPRRTSASPGVASAAPPTLRVIIAPPDTNATCVAHEFSRMESHGPRRSRGGRPTVDVVSIGRAASMMPPQSAVSSKPPYQIEVIAKLRCYDVARPPRPCCKGEGALATSSFTSASSKTSRASGRDARPYRILQQPLLITIIRPIFV